MCAKAENLSDFRVHLVKIVKSPLRTRLCYCILFGYIHENVTDFYLTVVAFIFLC